METSSGLIEWPLYLVPCYVCNFPDSFVPLYNMLPRVNIPYLTAMC
jgi:hypothetical protein